METRDSEFTRTVKLDLEKENEKTVNIENKEYTIQLLDIGKEELDGQSFPVFKFNVIMIEVGLRPIFYRVFCALILDILNY